MVHHLFFAIAFALIMINIVRAINLKIVTHIDSLDLKDIYGIYVNDFNEYSQKNNLDIHLEFVAFTKENSTVTVKGYEDYIQDQLINKSTENDLYFYDNIFTFKFGPHFLPLNNLIPDETFKYYESGIANEISKYNKKWVALPIKLDATFMYINQNVLNQYNSNGNRVGTRTATSSAPKTWDELIKIAKPIKDAESQKDPNFVAYNGMFSDNEMGTCSLFEFFHSFRKSADSKFPNFQSEEMLEALEMMKKLMKEVSSMDVFRATENEVTNQRFESGKFLFQKFWYRPQNNMYQYSTLPGKSVGVTGSTLGGYNLAINNYISDEKKAAAVTVFKYITSYETQKRMVSKYHYFSAIPSIYSDPDVCSNVNVNCEVFKNTQFIARPASSVGDYSLYSEKFRGYIYKFLYDDEITAVEALKKVYEISILHTINLDRDESVVGFINVVTITALSVIILFSTIFIFRDKFKPFLKFLPIDFWCISIMGSYLMMHALYAEIGEINTVKCHIKPIFLTLGFTLSYIPVFYKLVVNFPKKNKFSNWAFHNRYLFLLLFVALDIIFYEFYFVAPYTVNLTTTIEGRMYNICQPEKLLTKVVLYIMIGFRALILLASIFFIFVEWHLKESLLDLKFLLAAIVSDTICCIIMLVLTNSKIQKDDFLTYYLIFSVLVIILALSNYIFIFGIKIIVGFFSSGEEMFDTPIHFEKSLKGSRINVKNFNGASQTRSFNNYAVIDNKNNNIISNNNNNNSNNNTLNNDTLNRYSNTGYGTVKFANQSYNNNNYSSNSYNNNNFSNNSYNNNLSNLSSNSYNNNLSNNLSNNTYFTNKSVRSNNSSNSSGFRQKIMDYHNKASNQDICYDQSHYNKNFSSDISYHY